ncbi:MAG: hypothetical protein QM753_16775 [Thermomicrobiales bacterium]
MIQRSVGMYIANQLKDQILTPKQQAQADAEAGIAPAAAQQVRYPQEEEYDDLDGQILRDADGNSLGRAYRVPSVAIYVISRDGRNPAAALRRAIEDGGADLHFLTNDQGRITSVVYIADQQTAPTGIEGARADDV